MNMLALTIILPLIGFVLLAFSRGRWSENVSAIVGVGFRIPGGAGNRLYRR